MSALAVALLGVAALCAEGSARAARCEDVRRRARGDAIRTGTRVFDPIRTMRVAAVPAVAGFAGMVIHGAIGSVVGVAAALGARRLGFLRRARAREARRDEQVADAVSALTAAVRSGMSVPQAVAYAMREAEEPVAGHLARLVADVELGVPLGDAVDAWAERTESEDAQLVAGALDLHRRSGGDLPAVLDQVAATIRERVAVGRETRALTAQARLSGWILGVLPIGFFGFLWLTSRRDIQAALSTPAGLASVLTGVGLEVGAFFWIRSLLRVG
jgi:tight adherence protein B